jgi:hypothetical protein
MDHPHKRQHSVRYIKDRTKKPSRWWYNDKNLGLRGLLPLWSQVRALWLLIWWPLEAYMVVNFRAHGISRGARKLARTPTLKKKKKTEHMLRFTTLKLTLPLPFFYFHILRLFPTFSFSFCNVLLLSSFLFTEREGGRESNLHE